MGLRLVFFPLKNMVVAVIGESEDTATSPYSRYLVFEDVFDNPESVETAIILASFVTNNNNPDVYTPEAGGVFLRPNFGIGNANATFEIHDYTLRRVTTTSQAILSDLLNGSSPMTSHTADTGQTWVAAPHLFFDGMTDADLTLSGGAITADHATSSNVSGVAANNLILPANSYIEIHAGFSSVNVHAEFGLGMRYNNSNGSGIFIPTIAPYNNTAVDYGGVQAWRGGADPGSIIESGGERAAVANSRNFIFRAEFEDTAIRVYGDGVLAHTYTSNYVMSGGTAAVWLIRNTGTPTTAVQIFSIEAGSLASGGGEAMIYSNTSITGTKHRVYIDFSLDNSKPGAIKFYQHANSASASDLLFQIGANLVSYIASNTGNVSLGTLALTGNVNHSLIFEANGNSAILTLDDAVLTTSTLNNHPTGPYGIDLYDPTIKAGVTINSYKVTTFT